MRIYFILGMAGLGLVGCDANNDEKPTAAEAGARIDQAGDAADKKLEDVGEDLDRAGEAAKAEAKAAEQDLKAVGRNATQEAKEVGQDVKDSLKKGANKVDRAADVASRELKKDE